MFQKRHLLRSSFHVYQVSKVQNIIFWAFPSHMTELKMRFENIDTQVIIFQFPLLPTNRLSIVLLDKPYIKYFSYTIKEGREKRIVGICRCYIVLPAAHRP